MRTMGVCGLRLTARCGFRVHYGQLYVQSGFQFDVDLNAAFSGQANGLCGGAVHGFLWLVTGLHTGPVGFVAGVHDRAPELDGSWEEVVEVAFRPGGEPVNLVLWGGEGVYPLDLVEIDYRVRYSAAGMDAGRAADTRRPEDPLRDRYLLQFWPAAPAPDEVLKQTSEIAAYWHNHARGLPPASQL